VAGRWCGVCLGSETRHSNISQVGHSLGAELARESTKHSKKNDEVITLNRPVLPSMLKDVQRNNEVHIRTIRDPISILEKLHPKNKNNIIIDNSSRNPFKQHAVKNIDLLEYNDVGNDF
jgi:hypothetical protein